jgi:hypothetical protein
MPEGMNAGGKGVLVQDPPTYRDLYIWQAMTWQATLDLGAIDSAAGGSAPHPCARIWTWSSRYVTFISFVPNHMGSCHNKAIIYRLA